MRQNSPRFAQHSAATSPAPGMQVLSVSELTRCIRGVIEAEDLFADVWVRGEVSNLTKHASGHMYFSLKDQDALIRCVMWSNIARSVHFDISDGMSLIVRGRVSVYEKQGQYQLVLSEITPDGIGTLYLAYEQLKAKLLAEGMFDEARKKKIPAFPQRIAIVTSPTGAALRDMVTIARRRMPSVNLLLVPTLMQGPGSEAAIADSLRLADGTPDIDLIVLGRGGGSIEDLWSFNSEEVVCAIYACSTPVVSAVGHETDYTLSDLAADLRAPTPSAAMELIVPECRELAERVRGALEAATAAVIASISQKRAALDVIVNTPCFKYPERMFQDRRQTVDLLEERLSIAFRMIVTQSTNRLRELSARLEGLSPLAVFARGYGIVRRLADGSAVRRASDVAAGELTETMVSDGTLISEVKDVKKGWG